MRFIRSLCGGIYSTIVTHHQRSVIGPEENTNQLLNEEHINMSALLVEFIENVSTEPLERILGVQNDALAYPAGHDVGAQVDGFEDLARHAALPLPSAASRR